MLIAKKYGDFKMWYDTTQKRHYWTMGYMGNASVQDIFDIGKEFSEIHKVPVEKVKFDEILSSRRYKSFKFFSSQEPQEQHPDAVVMNNVYQHLRD